MTIIIAQRQLLIWFRVLSAILVFVGILFVFFGLRILPVDREILLPWESAIYGAIMMGWGTTLLQVGRLAFQRNDPDIMKAILYGLIVWLVVEATASVYFGVWFNVGVDIAVLALFSIPLLKGITHSTTRVTSSGA
jgi:hypothetical protein